MVQDAVCPGVGVHSKPAGPSCWLKQNRTALDAFCGQAFEAGISARRIAIEEYFSGYLKS